MSIEGVGTSKIPKWRRQFYRLRGWCDDDENIFNLLVEYILIFIYECAKRVDDRSQLIQNVLFDDRKIEFGYLTGVLNFLTEVFVLVFFVCKQKVVLLLRKTMKLIIITCIVIILFSLIPLPVYIAPFL